MGSLVPTSLPLTQQAADSSHHCFNEPYVINEINAVHLWWPMCHLQWPNACYLKTQPSRSCSNRNCNPSSLHKYAAQSATACSSSTQIAGKLAKLLRALPHASQSRSLQGLARQPDIQLVAGCNTPAATSKPDPQVTCDPRGATPSITAGLYILAAELC